MVRLSKVDPSSFSEPERVTTDHIALHWNVDFETKKLLGSATYRFKILEDNLPSIILDVRDITISKIELLLEDQSVLINYALSDQVKDVGAKLTLNLPENTKSGDIRVRIEYETSKDASALQWLRPDQTLGKQHPYMFSQCHPIHARSILPCQDTPAVKFTFEAILDHPSELTALMGAIVEKHEKGKTTFKQDVPVPSYLISIAVGKLVSRSLGPYSCVWAEEEIVEDSAQEFSDTDKILKLASDICGPYIWKRCDLIIMPPSFPHSGVENPCLIFLTPTILAGDKSLVDIIAHEISHSWTGNLVTNKNFEHFWLNEGFTVFIETKIISRMRGKQAADYHMLCNLTELQACLTTQLAKNPELSKLVVDLSDFGPDDAFSDVPYFKGSTFLRYVEDLLGGPEVFEPFLRSFLKQFAYKCIVTDDFKNALIDFFKDTDKKEQLKKIDWDLWLNQPGMPPIIPNFDQSLALVTKKHVDLWTTKKTNDLKNDPVLQEKLNIHQLIDFLGKLIEQKDIVDFSEDKVQLLETTFDLKESKNCEVRFRLARLYIKAKLSNRIDDILTFLNSNFRNKFSRPIYRDLAEWPETKKLAIDNFERYKDQMMFLVSHTIATELGLK